MGKVHKSLRLDDSIADRVKESMLEGETETAAYARVIRAGLDAIDGNDERDNASSDVSVLHDHIETLKTVNAELLRQIEVKDAQIESMTEITKAAQTLHAMNETKALEAADGKKRGRFRSWLFGEEN